MSVSQPIIVLGHGPAGEAIAMALAGEGAQVHYVAPLPDGLPFTLPLVCPVPELAALPSWPDLHLQEPSRYTASPISLVKQGNSYTLTLDDGTELVAPLIMICSSRWAVKLLPQIELSLPFRPVRAHQLLFSNQQFFEKPRAEHLGYGTVAGWTDEANTTLIYDGLADPVQATFSLKTDPRVVAALCQWLTERIYPQEITAQPEVTAWGLATTPDYLPVIGPWPGVEGLWMCSGYAAWGASLAMALAGLLVTTIIKGQNWPAHLACVGPGRFRDGMANPVLRPFWLIERNDARIQPVFAETVRLVGGNKVNMRTDTKVQMVGPSKATAISSVRTSNKSNIKMASVGFKS